ncbi:MAG: SAM-dependent methyltransferase, partial [Rhodoferax sp.]|nr:SAM-dependent methyltransferase [Rhodoferax sp.]
IDERFFGVALGRELAAAGKSADLTAANNVLAHVPDINDFVGGFTALLKPQGVATFEFPHLMRMVQFCQFDTAYHEHYSYLSLTAVQRIFEANGLKVFDVQELPTHGGSLRVFAQRADAGGQAVTPAVRQLLDAEAAAGMLTTHFYSQFDLQPRRIVRELLSFLIKTAEEGGRVGAYGAAAKGNTLCNFAGVRPHLLPYVVDKNPAKQGKFMPGSRIPIVDEAHLRAHRPSHVLILPWNLKGEVMAQLSYIREWGGRFVTAVPRLEILP